MCERQSYQAVLTTKLYFNIGSSTRQRHRNALIKVQSSRLSNERSGMKRSEKQGLSEKHSCILMQFSNRLKINERMIKKQMGGPKKIK